MIVAVVLVVHVEVIVGERSVVVEMLVTFPEHGDHAHGHARSYHQLADAGRVAEEWPRGESTDERCNREDRRLSGRAEESQRVGVEDDRDAERDPSQRNGTEEDPGGGELGTECEREADIDRSGDAGLDRGDTPPT